MNFKLSPVSVVAPWTTVSTVTASRHHTALNDLNTFFVLQGAILIFFMVGTLTLKQTLPARYELHIASLRHELSACVCVPATVLVPAFVCRWNSLVDETVSSVSARLHACACARSSFYM